MNASIVDAPTREALPSLCAALDLGDRTQEALALLGPAVGLSTLSFTLGPRRPELRLVVGAPIGVPLEPLDRVADLFEPPHDGPPRGGARVWRAVLRDGAPPRFQVLLDARAQGRWRAAAVAEEALVRSGFGGAWPSMAEQVLRRGPYLDEVRAVAIDLGADGDRSAIEVHVNHHDATPADLRAALGSAPLAERVEELCLALTGSTGPYRGRPFVSTHTFVTAGAALPSSVALHVPVAAYALNDAVTRGRISAYLAQRELDGERYERALAACARRPPATTAGLHGSLELREEAGKAVVTVGLALDARAATDEEPSPRGADAASAGPGARSATLPSPEEIVRRFENDIVLADHPFLRRLAREPVQLGHLWLMIANFWEGIVQDFPKRLAQVIARIDDDRIRCVLTKQLNDELGEGVFEEAHRAMFQTLVRAVEPHRLPRPDDVLLAPGRAFGRELQAMLFSDDTYETVGAMMMIEVYGKQTDMFMGAQFRRQDRIDAASLRWLHLHEGLEVDHADDSFKLARCVPADPAAIAATWRGAEAVVTAGRHYFDAFYRICFA